MLIAKNTQSPNLEASQNYRGKVSLAPSLSARLYRGCPARTGRGRLICGPDGGRSLWLPLTFAILEHGLHGVLAVRGPADARRAGDLVLDGPPALPQVHLMVIVNKEKCCEGKARPDYQGLLRGRFQVTFPHT